MSVIFLGPPGVGKGTQSEIFAKNNGFIHITTGNLLRKFSQGSSELAKTVKEKMDSGALVNDDLVFKILVEYLKSFTTKKVIFDGIPRNVEQAITLAGVIKDAGIKISHVINFCIDEDILSKRILGRFVCNDCLATYNEFFNRTKLDGVCDYCGSESFSKRSDDNDTSLKLRLKLFKTNNSGIKRFYAENGLLYEISADRDPICISKDINSICNTR